VLQHLNPATNVMNPHAEAALSRRLGSRPSLGYPRRQVRNGARCDRVDRGHRRLARGRGLRRQICGNPRRLWSARNLYGFMATGPPGRQRSSHHRQVSADTSRIMPQGAPGSTGLVTLNAAGRIATNYTIDVPPALRARSRSSSGPGSSRWVEASTSFRIRLRKSAGHCRRGGSEGAVRCGTPVRHDRRKDLPPIRWPRGVPLMTMSTYKSLGGPAGGLIVTNDAGHRAEARRQSPFPGLTANFDAAIVGPRSPSRCSTGASSAPPTRRRWWRPRRRSPAPWPRRG